jgi:hypothetical protein
MQPTTPFEASITPQQSFIVSRNGDFGRIWCVYEHHDADNNLLYVGVCKLIEVFSYPDARQNSEWIKRFPVGEPMVIKITMTSAEFGPCNNARTRQVQSMRPVCNTFGYSYHGIKIKIICNETKEEFVSITQAALAHGVSASALSNHLNQKPGHRSVKGKTYRKGV